MKYIEQRIQELETEVTLLKAKFKLQETKTTGFINKPPIRLQKKDTSHYLNNYSPVPDWRNKEISDYMYNPSINLLSEPDLETAFAASWDSSEIYKNPLDTVTVNLSSILSDTFPNSEYTDSSDLPEYYPPYPNFISSWDDKSFNDVINENVTDEYGFKMNDNEVITSWGFVSEFDKMDKDFLKWLGGLDPQELKSFINVKLKTKE